MVCSKQAACAPRCACTPSPAACGGCSRAGCGVACGCGFSRAVLLPGPCRPSLLHNASQGCSWLLRCILRVLRCFLAPRQVYTGKIEGCPVILIRPDWNESNLFRGGRIYGGGLLGLDGLGDAGAVSLVWWCRDGRLQSCWVRCWRTNVGSLLAVMLPNSVCCSNYASNSSPLLGCCPALPQQAPTTRRRRTSTSLGPAWSTCGKAGGSQMCCTCTSGRPRLFPCWWVAGRHPAAPGYAVLWLPSHHAARAKFVGCWLRGRGVVAVVQRCCRLPSVCHQAIGPPTPGCVRSSGTHRRASPKTCRARGW